jgi:hypothetical protein
MNYKVRTEVQYGRIRMNNLDLPTNKRIALPVSLTPPSLRGSPLVSRLEYPLRPQGLTVSQLPALFTVSESEKWRYNVAKH